MSSPAVCVNTAQRNGRGDNRSRTRTSNNKGKSSQPETGLSVGYISKKREAEVKAAGLQEQVSERKSEYERYLQEQQEQLSALSPTNMMLAGMTSVSKKREQGRRGASLQTSSDPHLRTPPSGSVYLPSRRSEEWTDHNRDQFDA